VRKAKNCPRAEHGVVEQIPAAAACRLLEQAISWVKNGPRAAPIEVSLVVHVCDPLAEISATSPEALRSARNKFLHACA
jgi:hypothetical protein